MNNLEIKFIENTKKIDKPLKFVVIATKYKEKWIYCRHTQRSTWEIPGGHIEQGETPLQAAKRELYEETGATNFVIKAISIYNVIKNKVDSFGMLYFAQILELASLPESEIAQIDFFDNLPSELTYPDIQPCLYNKAQTFTESFDKKLLEMADDELSALFPIILKPHNRNWANWYKQEKEKILNAVSNISAIHHYGSTSIPNIIAKPTIDIMVEIDNKVNLQTLKCEFINIGYFLMNTNDGLPMLAKGYTKYGFAKKIFHIHVRYVADQHELLFRDYLIKHVDDAKKYEQLKQTLKESYEYDRDGYTDAKSEFIRNIVEKAKKEKFNNTYRFSVHAIILNEKGQVLQLKQSYKNKLWGLPGGGVEPCETIHEALKRECMEEIGVDINIIALTGFYYHEHYNSQVGIFMCKIDGETKIRLSEEHSEYKYFDINNLGQVQQRRVMDAIDFDGVVASRAFPSDLKINNEK